MAIFLFFALSVLWLRSAAGIDATDFGVSLWVERGATEARLNGVLDLVLEDEPLAAWLAQQPLARTLSSADGEPAQRWKGILAMAEAVTSDDARARLAKRWAGQLSGSEERLRGLVRAVQKAQAASRAKPEGLVADIRTLHREALEAVVPNWLAAELPAAEVETILLANDLEVASPKEVKGRPKRANPGAAARVADQDAFVAGVHQAVGPFVAARLAAATSTDAISDDLSQRTAQEGIVKGVERDFSGRWMWTLLAALFLTAAVSAMVGGFTHVRDLGSDYARGLPAAYVVAVAAGLFLGWRLPENAPAFLSEPLDGFTDLYGVALQSAARILNTTAVGAIFALIFTAGSSFLVETASDAHLDRQLGTLRWTFHTSTFVLVVGVLEIYALFQWPSAFLGESAAALVQNGARTSAIALGAIFSTLLLLIYLPGANVLMDEARARQRHPDEQTREPDKDRAEAIDEMLKIHGFDGPPTQQIGRFAQLFAPLLVAPMAELVGLLE